MASTPRTLVFDPEQPAEVVDHMRRLRDSGRGWVNLEPEIPDDDVRLHQPGGILSNRGPEVPFCTWTAPTTDRKGRTGPQAIGVQHATGARARVRLDQVRLDLPAGWVMRSDNPKRGMVVELPAEADVATVLDWLLAAGEALSTVAVTGRWHAAIYSG